MGMLGVGNGSRRDATIEEEFQRVQG